MKKRIGKLIRKPIFYIFAIVIIILLIYFYSKGSDKEKYDFTYVERQNEIVEEVNATGRIKPSESVDLTFDISGRVAGVYVGVGDIVEAGQTLVKIDNSDLSAQLLQATAGVESAKAALDIQVAKLEEMKSGTRAEEIEITRTSVDNAERRVVDAEINLENANNKAEADINNLYKTALSTITKSVDVALGALYTITDIQYDNFNSYDQDSIGLAGAKADAVYYLLGASNGGRVGNSYLSELDGGAKGTVEEAKENITAENVEEAVSQVKSALEKVQVALNAIPINYKIDSTEISSVNLEKTNMGNELITVTGSEQSIAVQKSLNQSLISTATSQLNDASNALALAKNEFSLAEAGSTPQQIKAQEAYVRQAEANISSSNAQVASIQAKIAKTILRSPIKGIVSRQDAKVGEIVSMGISDISPLVSIISESDFEIEVNISEADIVDVEISDPCEIILDALPEETLAGHVVFVDPAQQLVGGVIYYKVRVGLDEMREKIKSGMTADVTIITDYKEGVLTVPRRAVVERNGDNFIRVLEWGVVKEIKVETGIEGVGGGVEIISGVEEGDKVITFIRK